MARVLNAERESVRNAPFVLYVNPTDARRRALRQRLQQHPDCVQLIGDGVDASRPRFVGVEAEFRVQFDTRFLSDVADPTLLDVRCYECTSGELLKLQRRGIFVYSYLPRNAVFHTVFALYAGLNIGHSPCRVSHFTSLHFT